MQDLTPPPAFYYSLIANAGFGRPSGTEIARIPRNFKTCLLSSPAVYNPLSFTPISCLCFQLYLSWAVQDLAPPPAFYYSLIANAGFGRPSGTEIARIPRNFKTCLLSSPAVYNPLSFTPFPAYVFNYT
jgi:hypothetical protein